MRVLSIVCGVVLIVLFVKLAQSKPPWMYCAASLLSTMVAFHIGWFGRGLAERQTQGSDEHEK